MHEGDSIPGFPSIYAFLYLLSPKLKKLKEPALELLSNVFEFLRDLTSQLCTQIFGKFKSINEYIIELIDRFLTKQRDESKHILEAVIESEINYIFTNDEEYLTLRTKLFPFEEE